jgi:hypothetical protein
MTLVFAQARWRQCGTQDPLHRGHRQRCGRPGLRAAAKPRAQAFIPQQADAGIGECVVIRRREDVALRFENAFVARRCGYAAYPIPAVAGVAAFARLRLSRMG